MGHTTAGAGPLADYSVGDRVMTVEGYPGTVDDIHEGPGDLTTVFVTLDNGMGGGEYAEAEIQPLTGSKYAQAHTTAQQAAIIEAGVTHTAADDYPELGTILSDRLPPTLQQRLSSKTANWTDTELAKHTEACVDALGEEARQNWESEGKPSPWRADHTVDEALYAEFTQFHRAMAANLLNSYPEDFCSCGGKTAGAAWTHADDDEWDDDLSTSRASTWTCTGCGETYDPAHPEGDQHDHWTSYDGSGPHTALYLPPVPQSEQRASTTDIPENQRAGYAEGFEQGKTGITREPSQPEDLDFMAGYDIGWAEGVTVHREPANSWDIDDLGKDQTADIPATAPTAFGPTMGSLVDLGMPAVEAGAFDDVKQWVDENSQPGSRFTIDWCRFRRNSHCWLPSGLNEAASEQAGYAVWEPMDRGYCWRSAWETQQKCSTGQPGPRADRGFTDATVAWEDGGQRNGVPDPSWRGFSDTYSPATQPGGIMASKTAVGPHEYVPTPPYNQICSVCDVWRWDKRLHPNEPDRPKPDPEPESLWQRIFGSLVREGAFEVTASWADVRRKAKRLRESGGVRIAAAHDNIIVGHIKGDNGVYETEIVSFPGKRNAATWSCGCKWSSYSWGRSGPWKKYEGRMCSHALALQYEAQSRGMGGKTITPDSDQPTWMDSGARSYTPARQASLHTAGPLDDGLRSRIRSATTLEQAAAAMMALARREEPKALSDIQTLVNQNHGQMVGLEHRLKKESSLLRKMKAEATLFRNPGECAMNMSDTLRFTALLHFDSYTQDTNDILNGLRSRGYKTRVKNFWGRGDAYNGVNVALTTPNGHPVELQFHTEESFRIKEEQVHPIYEAWRVEPDANRKAILGYGMRQKFDMAHRPPGALGIEGRKQQPFVPYKDIQWLPRAASAMTDGDLDASAFHYLALHYIDGDPDTPDEVYAVLRTDGGHVEIWEHGQWLEDSSFGRYFFLGDPTSEEITAEEASAYIVALAGARISHHRPVVAQVDDEAPVHGVLAAMAAEGAKYAEMREMLLSAGVAEPAKMVATARRLAKDESVSPSEHGDPRLQDAGVSVKKDDDGYYVTTHRLRSKSYESVGKIPDSEIERIEATGAYVTEQEVRDGTLDASHLALVDPETGEAQPFLDWMDGA